MATEIPLLSTKLFLPAPRATLVPRPRLTAHLVDGLTRPLTLVSAPAGSGKTTLISEWRASPHSRTVTLAWLSIDQHDNDPVRFLTYLIAAVAAVRPGFGEMPQAWLRSARPQPPAAETILTHLISELAELETPLALVLDDYHLITTWPVHDALAFLLDHLPPQMHLVILTRADPPLALARLRVRNQLTEIRAADLRFTTEEAATFLQRTMGLSLSPEDVAALEARTEGWIAGLQLAALALRGPLSTPGRSDTAGFVTAFTGSHTYVAEYLVEEVIQHQSEGVQKFLLQTSILERLNPGLCAAVSGCPDGQAVLLALHRANVFVTPLDNEGQWFRYHHLFADLLQARLRQVLSADAIAALHQRASAWYEQNGFAVEAVNHSLAAKDFDSAARLVEQNAEAMTTRGELATLLQWIESLPSEVTQRRPASILAIAWVLTFAGAVQQVETLLQQAEAQIAGDDKTWLAREVRGNAAAIRAYFTMLGGDYESALTLAERAEALLPPPGVEAGVPTTSNYGARSILPYTLGVAYRGRGQYDKAAEAFAREAQLGAASGNMIVWATGVTEMINTSRGQGRLRQAAETGRLALQQMRDQGASAFGSLAKVEIALADVLREQNELGEARTRVTGAIARMETWGMPTDRLFGYLTLARIQESQGDLAGALESLQSAKEQRATHSVLFTLARAVDLLEIRLLLGAKNLTAAERLLESLRPGSSQIIVVREQELTMLARVRLAQDRPDEAAAILTQIAGDAGLKERVQIWLEVLALQACAAHVQGNPEAAVTVLLAALALAEPEGFVHVFVDEAPALQPVLAMAARRLSKATDPASIILAAYIARLLDAFVGRHPPGAASQTPSLVTGLIEPLTPREFEVMQLIAAGDSNQMIADKFVITLSAVKKHAGNIFSKLNVNNRTQAVARARQLGLLSADR